MTDANHPTSTAPALHAAPAQLQPAAPAPLQPAAPAPLQPAAPARAHEDRPDAFGTFLRRPEGVEVREEYLELIGTHLRASGVVDLGRFRRVTDYVNLLDGFFALRDVVLLTRTGETTRVTMPELRVRLDEVAIVGQLEAKEIPRSTDLGVHVEKTARRLVVMTAAHIIYGFVYTLEGASLMQFLDSSETKFLPMTRVRVRWLADRRLAGRFPFALVQRNQILGVATEGTGAPREARARRKAAVVAAMLTMPAEVAEAAEASS